MERRCRIDGFAGEPLIFLLLRLMHLTSAELCTQKRGVSQHKAGAAAPQPEPGQPVTLVPPERRGKVSGMLRTRGRAWGCLGLREVTLLGLPWCRPHGLTTRGPTGFVFVSRCF